MKDGTQLSLFRERMSLDGVHGTVIAWPTPTLAIVRFDGVLRVNGGHAGAELLVEKADFDE